ncbi:thiol-disulfide oxidoreductase DCC family protein [Streptomyces polyrhachis]|uniref:Thiol-disulfide oxidoreductase DCC family protein n=1 Tax=Streptomyces polyrhachis TaxID=1282885 RepID=A0ABW2GE15_9ACTN
MAVTGVGGAVLVYDGDCGFCTSAVHVAERWIRPRCRVVPWQFADLEAWGVARERAQYEVLWITPGGRVFGGVRAVSRLLRSAGRGWGLLGLLLGVPPLRWLGHGVYRLIADNRHRLPGGTPACAVRPGDGVKSG